MGQLVAEEPLFFPDVENIVATFLRGRPEFDGVSVGPVLPPDFDGTKRAVVLTRLGGAFREDDSLDVAEARIDTYSVSKVAAQALANTVRGVLPLATRVSHAGGVVLSDLEEMQGPCWTIDRKHEDSARYVMRYRLFIVIRPMPV